MSSDKDPSSPSLQMEQKIFGESFEIEDCMSADMKKRPPIVAALQIPNY